jgi:DNA-binding response OmpR family regulator
VAFGDSQRGKFSVPTGYRSLVASRLTLIEDDLMFGQRVRAAARRLGVGLDVVTAAKARLSPWQAGDVIVLQATLRPEQQVQLVQELLRKRPAPKVIAVTGHLETPLRRRLKALGAGLAAHSSIDRALARALGITAGARDADDAREAGTQPLS